MHNASPLNLVVNHVCHTGVTVLECFMASLRKRGERWQVQIRRQDAPTVSKSFYSKSAAKAWALKTEALIESGEYTYHQSNCEMLSDILVRYRDEVSNQKKGATTEIYRINKVLKHPIASERLKHLKPSIFAEYRDERLSQVSSSSVRRELVILRHCLSLAINEWGIGLRENPILKLNIPRESQPRERRVSSEELKCLLSNCKHKALHLSIELALETGMRRSELLNSKWQDVDLDKGLLHISLTKNGSSRSIPLTPRAIELLSYDRGSSCSVIPISANALRLAWARLCRRCRVIDLRFQDLRHEAVSRFFEMGLSIAEVQLISGHQDVRMLMRYTHLKPEAVRDKLL